MPLAGREMHVRLASPRCLALAPHPEPARDEADQRGQHQEREEEELLKRHRPSYPFGGAAGSSPVPAMASRIAVSACTFFIR